MFARTSLPGTRPPPQELCSASRAFVAVLSERAEVWGNLGLHMMSRASPHSPPKSVPLRSALPGASAPSWLSVTSGTLVDTPTASRDARGCVDRQPAHRKKTHMLPWMRAASILVCVRMSMAHSARRRPSSKSVRIPPQLFRECGFKERPSGLDLCLKRMPARSLQGKLVAIASRPWLIETRRRGRPSARTDVAP